MRVGVVDIGTNSTRLLIADVDDRGVQELVRESVVTRLGEGVDATGALGDEPQQRVFRTLDRYRALLDQHGVDSCPAVLTSAVRDSSNGAEFTDTVRERYRLDARTLSGDEEARLGFRGATAARNPDDPATLLVIDIGGGSTEMITGARGEMSFHVSIQAGVVRMTERHIHSDPPAPSELQNLAADIRPLIVDAVPEDVRRSVDAAIAVAGTATTCAAIDLDIEPYDPARVEGHGVTLGAIEEMEARLAQMSLARRRETRGLHPDRAPTIVAGMIILSAILRAFALEGVTVSERDILWGVALASAR